METGQETQCRVVALFLHRLFQTPKLIGVILRLSVQFRIVADDDTPLLFGKMMHGCLSGAGGFFEFPRREQGLAEHHRHQPILRIIYDGMAPRPPHRLLGNLPANACSPFSANSRVLAEIPTSGRGDAIDAGAVIVAVGPLDVPPFAALLGAGYAPAPGA